MSNNSESSEIKMAIQIESLDNMDIYSEICILGKLGSGKSFIVRDLINGLNKTAKFTENLLIISPNEEHNKFYENVYPSSKIVYKYNNTILHEYFAKIKNMSAEERKDFHGCIVLDDCLTNRSLWNKDPEICNLFYNARHYHVTFIISAQYSLKINSELRGCFDYIFLLYDDDHNKQKKAYKHYGGIFPTVDSFRQVYLQLTENFGSMVIKNRINCRSIFDKISFYKIEQIEQIEQ